MEGNTWGNYVEKTKERGPRELLVEALPYSHKRDEALDLGAGALNESRYLLEQGFKRVTAMDQKLLAKEIAESLPPEKFKYVLASFDDFNFPENKFDLVNAQYSLQFNPKESFDTLFEKIKRSLIKEGVFTGQIFGDRDEWKDSEMEINLHDKKGVERLLSDMEIIKLLEVEKDEPSATRSAIKHWHYFDIIARAR
jgi:ubiquinone/menaquinone biosynthesis C-methylase UbiE